MNEPSFEALLWILTYGVISCIACYVFDKNEDKENLRAKVAFWVLIPYLLIIVTAFSLFDFLGRKNNG
jgi:uncharacterized membrane protein (GlpM family)